MRVRRKKMIKIKPIITEKSIRDAKNGKYTFIVPTLFTKANIKEVISSVFGVKVKRVRTINYYKLVRRGFKRLQRKRVNLKKAVVELYPKEKIDLFEVKEK